MSVDHPALADLSLYEAVEFLFRKGVTSVYLDEIHAARSWSLHLKALYDSWPKHKIWASGSNSLLLISGVGDLSRRFVGVAMPLLSFREYLALRGYPDFGPHDPFSDDTAWMNAVLNECPPLALFEDYLLSGFRPFFTEGKESYPQKLLQVVQKTLLADIPALVPSITLGHFQLMNAVLGYLSKSPLPVLQVNSLCREWNVGKEKLHALLSAMEQTGLLRIVRYPSDHAVLSTGAKLLLADPSLYPALSGKEGNLREAFVVAALQSSGRAVHASKDESAADFVVDGSFDIEIGGLRKNRKRARFVVRDGADYPAPGVIPLWALGFAW